MSYFSMAAYVSILRKLISWSFYNKALPKSSLKSGSAPDKGYILEVDVAYSKDLHDLHRDLPFLPERMKINKCNKLVCNLYDKMFFP